MECFDQREYAGGIGVERYADAGLTLRREGSNARVTMRWASGESLEDLIELAPNPDSLADGDAPLFVPEPSSRVPDVFAALGALGQPLYVVEGV